MKQSVGVPADFVKCKLFSFSLGKKARGWLKSLPPGSLKSWDEIKAAFLNHYYTNSRSKLLKDNIYGFQHEVSESFHEAWKRFNKYIRDCPHHGFTEICILTIFYKGVETTFKTALDSASNGNFMNKTVEEAYILIDNLAASNSSNCLDHDKTSRSTSCDSKEIVEHKAMMNVLLKNLQVKISGAIYQEFDGDQIHHQGEDAAHEHILATPQATANPAPSSQDNKLELLMQQLLTNQQKSENDINMKVDSQYNELERKFEVLYAHVEEKMDEQLAQTTKIFSQTA